jgi:hypothetical protein
MSSLRNVFPISVDLNVDQVEYLTERSKELGISRSKLVQQLVDRELSKELRLPIVLGQWVCPRYPEDPFPACGERDARLTAECSQCEECDGPRKKDGISKARSRGSSHTLRSAGSTATKTTPTGRSTANSSPGNPSTTRSSPTPSTSSTPRRACRVPGP